MEIDAKPLEKIQTTMLFKHFRYRAAHHPPSAVCNILMGFCIQCIVMYCTAAWQSKWENFKFPSSTALRHE